MEKPEKQAPEEKQPNPETNAPAGGHVASQKRSEVPKEQVDELARRAEQPEPKPQKSSDGPKAPSGEMVDNTGEDITATQTDADAATG